MSGKTGSKLPKKASVVVVGAGLSGLVAARDLLRAGVDDVVLVEAQNEVGGRVKAFVRDNGSKLERGAEFIGPMQPTVMALLQELDLEVKPQPMFEDPANVGSTVFVMFGERLVVPFAEEPGPIETLGAVAQPVADLIETVVVDEPWSTPNAEELDSKTVREWLAENVNDPEAREALEIELTLAGPANEVSMLHALAFFSRHCGFSGFISALPDRVVEGTSAMISKLAEELGDRVVLSAPVRKIKRVDGGAIVETDSGSIQADAVVVAMEPNLISAIEFDPPLPADRSLLQTRWLANPGAKYFVVYESPWWKDEGLSGFALGGEFALISTDISPYDTDEGILGGMIFPAAGSPASAAKLLQDPDQAREAVLADLERAFGPKARECKEVHVFDWNGDRWSRGAGGFALGPGALTGLGQSLREPVGPIFWAGEASGTGDYMEAAASAGKAAAEAVGEFVS
jgi:monoamine oxidase